jgi:uncharacterized OB-fold protein
MDDRAPKKVIDAQMIPDVGSRLVRRNNEDYLVVNDAMFTFYQRSMGEFSRFFLALRDEKRILGCRCSKCGIVRVPPFMTRCPDCDFAPTALLEISDVGVMLSTPPITYFANSLFSEQVPFGRGRVVLNGADTAMSVNFYTTKGILIPGIVTKGTEMKVIFKDHRVGEITDIFCVPVSELTTTQAAKRGLLSSELDWESATEPALPLRTDESIRHFRESFAELQNIVCDLNETPRARQDIESWRRNIHVKTGGGSLTLGIADATLSIVDGLEGRADFVMVCDDPSELSSGLGYRGSLTQAIIDGKLWISKNPEFTTIFKLERMARSLARAKKS